VISLRRSPRKRKTRKSHCARSQQQLKSCKLELLKDSWMTVDQHELDVIEEQLIHDFVQDGCKCDLGPNHSPCSTSITVDHFRSVCCQMADLTHDKLDLVVMGQVMAGCFSADTFHNQERSRSFTVFHHNGSRICQKTFLFLHTTG